MTLTKKPSQNSYVTLIFALSGLFLFFIGITSKNWFCLIGGMFLLMNGEITIIHYNGREND